MSTRETVPATPKALLSLGIAEWGSKGTVPISEAEFGMICALVYSHFDDMCAKMPVGWKEALLNDTRFLGWLPQYFHALAVLEISARTGLTLAGLDDASGFYQPDWSGLKNVIPRAANRSSLTRLPREIRRAWLGNSQLPPVARLLRLFQPADAWNYGARDALKSEFCAARNYFAWTPFAIDRIAGVEKPHSVDSGIADLFRSTVSAMCDAFEAHFLIYPDRDNILNTWLTRVSTFHAQIQSVLTWRHRPRVSLMSNAGNLVCRTMAAAARLSGDQVFVFHHGNNPGFTKAAPFSYVEFSLASEYVSATAGISGALQAVNEAMPPSRVRDTRFVSMNSSVYARLRSSLKPPRESSIRRILLAGYPSHVPPIRLGYGYGDYFAIRMVLELEVLRMLRTRGYEIAYKAHPETEPKIAQALRGEGTFDCAASFEDALQQVDLVVFTYPLTTAFGIALSSNLPIVLIDPPGRDWMPDIYEKVRQRCAMVPAGFNDRNLISVAQSELLDGIAAAPSLVSDIYFNSYLRPVA